MALIRRGCGCKSGCSSVRCKCKKSGTHCGPGCKCTGCTNLPVEALRPGQTDQSDSETDSVNSADSEVELNDEVDRLKFDINYLETQTLMRMRDHCMNRVTP